MTAEVRRAIVVGMVIAVVGAGVVAWRARGGPETRTGAGAGTGTGAGTGASTMVGGSNIHAADYVGPQTCGECHPENHARWQASLHASMNRTADEPGAIRGDFGGVTLRYAGGTARFDRDGDGAVMTLGRDGAVPRRFRVTRTIGSRYLQEYVGVEIGSAEAAEIRLPFGYWLRAAAWFPQPYFDSWFGAEYGDDGSLAVDPYQPETAPWATRCAWCHNTYPFELRVLRSQEREVGMGLEQYVELVEHRRSAADRAAIAGGNRLPVDELVTVGISCESCHLGGRDHAEDDTVAISFVPVSPALRRTAGAPDLATPRDNPVVINAICAGCHSTPSSAFPHGGVARNSSEALDLAAGACTSAIKCTDCHDPHVAGPGAGAPDQPHHLAACAGCHDHLATPAAALAHGRHPAGAASCLDCHMPRIVQGVSSFVRSHRISSPTDPAMLDAGAPNACNLCHLDRSIAWTLAELDRGWAVQASATAADRDAPVGLTWLGSSASMTRLAAAAAYGRSPLGKAALPALVAILDAPVAYDRMWIAFAIEDVLGRRLTADEYDPIASPATRAAQVGRLWERWLPVGQNSLKSK